MAAMGMQWPPGTRSADGQQEWNGSQWVPVGSAPPPFPGAPPPPPTGGSGLKVALVGVAVALVAGIAVFAFLATRPASTPTPTSSSGGSSSSSGSHSSSSSSSSTAAGSTYTDPGGQFTAVFPGTPKYQVSTASSPLGDLPYRDAEYTGGGRDEAVGVITLPAGATYDLDAGLGGITSKVSGQLLSSTHGTTQGFPSVDGHISFSGGAIEALIVHADKNVYIILTVGPRDPPSDFRSFSQSVHLTPH
jgi:hypothetical protein